MDLKREIFNYHIGNIRLIIIFHKSAIKIDFFVKYISDNHVTSTFISSMPI